MAIVKVTKINAEAHIAKALLEKNNLSIDDIKKNKEIRDEFIEQTGLDLSVFSFPLQFEILLDTSKILAMDAKIIDIPGIRGLRGYAIWFDNEVSHCWWITEESYELVKASLNSY